MVTIKVLFENQRLHKGIKAGHGLSVLIKTAKGTYLFDTGANKKLIHNSQAVGETLQTLTAVILSHGHCDHTGGLRYLPDKRVPIYTAIDHKVQQYLKIGPFYKKIGLSKSLATAPAFNWQPVTEDRYTLDENIHLLRAEKNTTSTENLFKGVPGAAKQKDDFVDELMLVIEDESGLIVFTGCSHHGVLAMLQTVRRHFPTQRIAYLIGGFHLIKRPYLNGLNQSAAEIQALGAQLAALPIDRIYTCHCTGKKGFALLAPILGERLQYIRAGEVKQLS